MKLNNLYRILVCDHRSFITRASVGKPESENANRCWSPKGGGHGPRRSRRTPWKLGSRTRLAFRSARCFTKNGLARIAPYVHIIYKDVDGCPKGSVHESYCLKATQVSRDNN